MRNYIGYVFQLRCQNGMRTRVEAVSLWQNTTSNVGHFRLYFFVVSASAVVAGAEVIYRIFNVCDCVCVRARLHTPQPQHKWVCSAPFFNHFCIILFSAFYYIILFFECAMYLSVFAYVYMYHNTIRVTYKWYTATRCFGWAPDGWRDRHHRSLTVKSENVRKQLQHSTHLLRAVRQ